MAARKSKAQIELENKVEENLPRFPFPPYDPVEAARNCRNKLLSDSDWTQLPDSPLTDKEKEEWATYRQALRDLDLTAPEVPFPPLPN